MTATTGPGDFRHRHVLLAVAILLLLAFSVALFLPGCDGDGTAVVTEEKEEETTTEDNGENTDSREEEEEEEGEEEEEEDGESVVLDAEYTNEMYSYSLSYPSDWELTEILNGHGCSITNPDKEEWEVLAWGDPDLGKTPEEWLEEHYSMMSIAMETERDPSTLDSGTFDGSDYVYDYWTTYVPVGEYYRYNEVFVAESGGDIFFVTGDYPVDDVEEAEPIVIGIMDSLTLP